MSPTPDPYHKASIEDAPVCKKNLTWYILLLSLLILFLTIFQISKPKRTPKHSYKDLKSIPKESLTSWDHIIIEMKELGYFKWGIPKVQSFYKDLTPIVIDECKKTGVPPAAILSIAGLESGFGKGYISQVSGNILSLNARKSEPVLPPLNIPFKEKQTVIDTRKLKKLLASGVPVTVKQRPPSLKKDYRPYPFAGTNTYLDFFLNHPAERHKAWRNNINDLILHRIRRNSPFKPYRDTYKICENIQFNRSLSEWISEEKAILFLQTIGGKKNSFNPYPSWVTKTISLTQSLGLETFLKKYLSRYHKDSVT